MVNKCFPHMRQDGSVQSKKCAAADKTQRRTGPGSNDREASEPGTRTHLGRTYQIRAHIWRFRNNTYSVEIRAPSSTFNLVHPCNRMLFEERHHS